ncbi:MAG: alpha/beta hydrolase [Anaerolineae bacterium]|nr:alpha/beta hydrolase [Anaerolineae bacterium]
MKRLILILLVALALTANLSAVVAQGNDTITLEPFTDGRYGLSGVTPKGWKTASPGVVQRGRDATDVTLLAQQAAPLQMEGLLNAVYPQFGLKEAPKSTGTHQGKALEWTLYRFEGTFQNAPVSFMMGLASKDGKTYIVLLQTTADEIDALTESVFTPVIDALAPVVEKPTEVAPYREEEVTFSNGDVTLAGTLSLPPSDGPHPAVVLVTGSGPQDRNEDIGFQLKPFKVIADYLTRQGIAVLRYDDRGVGKSTGDFAAATSMDLASDAAAALAYLQTRKDITPTEIGMLGHSEGGMIAAILGSQQQKFAFYVSLAGTAVDGAAILLKQNELIMRANGGTDEQIKTQIDYLTKAFDLMKKGDEKALETLTYEAIKEQVAALPEAQRSQIGDVEKYAKEQAAAQAKALMTPWYRYFISYDVGAAWEKTTTPVLAIFGGKDLQVSADQNAPAFEAEMKKAGNKDYKVVIFPKANHLMQEATTGSPNEYATLKQEFLPDVMPTIADWIKARVTIAK